MAAMTKQQQKQPQFARPAQAAVPPSVQASVRRPGQQVEAKAVVAQTSIEENDTQLRELEQVLLGLIACYEQMLEQSTEMRSAMSRADLSTLSQTVRTENELVQRVSDLEKRRMRVVGQLADRLGMSTKAQTRVRVIADRVAGEGKERLYGLAQRLGDLIQGVDKVNAGCKGAAESLATHMQGLIAKVAASMNHGRTYGSTGAVGGGAAVMSSLDLRS